MKKRSTLFLLALAISAVASAADPKYPIGEIPAALLKDANAVIRTHEESFTIHNRNRATHYVHKVISIMNAKAKDLATEVVMYDKLTKIKDLTAYAYDASGKQIKRLKNSEIYDQSASGDLSSDDRLKAVDLSQTTYPYTVEFIYEVEYKFLFYIPPFHALAEENIATQSASYELGYAPDLKPQYKTLNVATDPKHEVKDGIESLRWEFSDIAPVKMEPYSSYYFFFPIIHVAPSIIQFEGYSGMMRTWNDLGQWIASLNKDRRMLPEATKQKVRELTQNLQTREEKVRALYTYLQGKTRYVSIQLGIGGFQPFEASFVDRTGYGDCKALSNYMVAMLETIDIPAHYALIYAGSTPRPFFEDLPSSQFNHAVVAVPNGQDTLWLECTSQSNPFGYQGKFTGNRKALLITDEGAAIAKTIRYPATSNIKSRTANVKLFESGDGSASVTTRYSGLQYEYDGLSFVLNGQSDAQKKWALENTSIPSFDLNAFSFEDRKDKMPEATVNLDLTLKRYGSVSGKRMFLAPNLMNKWSFIPPKVENRKSPIALRTGFTDVDTVIFEVPEHMYPEYLPERVKISNKFGEYEAACQLEQGKVIYTRRLMMNEGQFPKEDYDALIEFHRAISKSDNAKIVFMSKT